MKMYTQNIGIPIINILNHVYCWPLDFEISRLILNYVQYEIALFVKLNKIYPNIDPVRSKH